MTVGELVADLLKYPQDAPLGLAAGAGSDLKILSIYHVRPAERGSLIDCRATVWIDLQENGD